MHTMVEWTTFPFFCELWRFKLGKFSFLHNWRFFFASRKFEQFISFKLIILMQFDKKFYWGWNIMQKFTNEFQKCLQKYQQVKKIQLWKSFQRQVQQQIFHESFSELRESFSIFCNEYFKRSLSLPLLLIEIFRALFWNSYQKLISYRIIAQ